MAGSSRIHHIGGSVPGLLDPTQPDRLLRLPGSRLHFASFDPLTATAPQRVANLRNLALGSESCPPKRIVVEIAPSGDSFWRYVPNARLDAGVEGEGQWPRDIEICGEVIECSQDQWDIYKLDPLYACHVRTRPNLTQITRVTDTKPPAEVSQRKRQVSPSISEGSVPGSRQRKRVHLENHDDEGTSDEEDMDGVEAMNVDTPPPPTKNRQETRFYCQERKGPRHRAKRTRGGIRNIPNLTPEDFQDIKKRKAPDILESPSIPDELENIKERQPNTYTFVQNGKRARTLSPTSSKRDLNAKRREREQLKKQRREQEMLAKLEKRDEKYFETAVKEAAYHAEANPNNQRAEYSKGEQSQDGDEELRRNAIEESKKKLAELEADKPQWEAAAKQRLKREREEEKTIRVQVEALRSTEKMEAERKTRFLQDEQEQRRKNSERRQREEAVRRERERREQQQQRWALGPWTTQRALERYKTLSNEFDSTKFDAELPLTMEAVPWPVLAPPARLNVADVSWEAVEKFFGAVRNHMKSQEYLVFVEKSHRRFHPDRWRSRSLLKTVLDETERDGMEVAANTVAQALTPIWREMTGRQA